MPLKEVYLCVVIMDETPRITGFIAVCLVFPLLNSPPEDDMSNFFLRL